MNRDTSLRDAGSRMHVLDLVDGQVAAFHDALDALLQPSGITLAQEGPWMPLGRTAPQEALLDRPGCPLLPPGTQRRLRAWWLAVDRPTASGPNWDLAANAVFPDGRPGLVLVEAKAHLGELRGEAGGKRTSPGSNPANHERIAAAIREARDGLGGEAAGVRISRDLCYQLSNRLAFAWKLAAEGLPTALVYLGFTGDEVIGRLSEPIHDDAAWRAAVAGHAGQVLDGSFWERAIDVQGTPLWLLVRSLPVRRLSPVRSAAAAVAPPPVHPPGPARDPTRAAEGLADGVIPGAGHSGAGDGTTAIAG